MAGPFTEGEYAGIFSLMSFPEQCYYEATDLSFEEFRDQNNGPGYPLKLPSVLNYEDWDQAGKPFDDEKYITHFSDEARINQLMDVMSRQLEGTNSDNKRDFVNADQTQSSSTTMSVLTLSLGNWMRRHRALKHEFSDQYRFLHKLIYQNSAHVVCITEADSLSPEMIRDIIYKGGMQAFRLKHGLAPAVMICLRGDSSASIELLHSNYQDWKRDSKYGARWGFIGGIFRVIYGRVSLGDDALVTSMHDKRGRPIARATAKKIINTAERIQTYQRHEKLQNKSNDFILCTGKRYKESAERLKGKIQCHDFPPCDIEVDGQGNEFVSLTIHPVTPEMRKEHPTVTDELDVFSTPPPAFAESQKDVKRGGFPEAVVSVFHLDHGIAKKPQLSHNALQRFLQRSLIYQADVVTGDANSAANRFFVGQELCHQRLSLFWYLLENNIRMLNRRIHQPFKAINATIECSSRVRDEYLSVQNHTDRRDGVQIESHREEQLDCMVTAVIAYGKYTEHKTSRVKCQPSLMSRREEEDELQRPLNVLFPEQINELRVSSVEKFKWTTRRSLMLGPNDGDYHLPLMVHCRAKKEAKRKSHEGTLTWMDATQLRMNRKKQRQYNN